MTTSQVLIGSLLKRARSGGGEAYALSSKGPGYRIGVGARMGSEADAGLFVEVVLDPFPDRPRVRPNRLREQAQHVQWLEARGYGITCDPDGTITCERTVSASQAQREVNAVRRRLRS